MRTGVTLADVTRAADQLLAEGERPTVEAVRKFLGTGAPATVNNHLKDYYQALPARLNMPSAIATAAADLYKAIRDTALQEVQDEQASRLQEVEREKTRLATDRRAYEGERESLLQQVAALQAESQSSHAAQAQLAGRISALERSLGEQAERAAGAESRAASAVEERDRQAQRHTQELQHIRTQAEGNERHLLARIDDLQTQIKRVTADREKDAAAHQKQTSSLESSLSESNKGLAALRNELANAQRELAQERAERQDRERTHTQEQARTAKDLASAVTERDRLSHELTKQLAVAKQLGKDRDDALREASRLEGKLHAKSARIDELREELAQARQPAGAGKSAEPNDR